MGNLLSGGGVPGVPSGIPTTLTVGTGKNKKQFDVSDILSDNTLSRQQKAQRILVRTGMKKTRKKYETEEDRKAAAKERKEKRRAERLNVLSGVNLAPAQRAKLSPEEKKARRKQKSAQRRDFFRAAAISNPELAAKFNVNPANIRKVPKGFNPLP